MRSTSLTKSGSRPRMFTLPGRRWCPPERLRWVAKHWKYSASLPAFRSTEWTFASATCRRKPNRCARSTSTRAATWDKKSWSAFAPAAMCIANLPALCWKARRTLQRTPRSFRARRKWEKSLVWLFFASPRANAR